MSYEDLKSPNIKRRALMERFSLKPTVIEACEKNWPHNQNDCSGFVRDVSRDLRILLPGTEHSFAADWITWLIREWKVQSTPMSTLQPGPSAAIEASLLASRGLFVVAGATSDEINAVHRRGEKPTHHGHVVVVTSRISATGWPSGYWGMLGGTGEKNQSISMCFRSALKEKLHYFYASL